jgi:hypothetical protein
MVRRALMIALAAWVVGGVACDPNHGFGPDTTGPGDDAGSSSPCARATSPVMLASSPQNVRDVAAAFSAVYWTTWGTDGSGDGAMIVSAPADGGQATVLAMGETAPTQITADFDNLYWIDAGKSLRMLPLQGGGQPTTLASPGESGPLGFAIDATNAYYTTASGVWSVPLAGGTPTKLVTDTPDAAIAVDDTYVYWVDHTPGQLQRVQKAGGGVLLLAKDATSFASTYAGSLAADGIDTYWVSTDEGIVWTMPSGGGPATQLVGGLVCPQWLRTFGAEVLFANDAVSCPANKTGNDAGQRAIGAAGPVGGKWTRVTDGTYSFGGAFASDGSVVYWGDQHGVYCAGQ